MRPLLILLAFAMPAAAQDGLRDSDAVIDADAMTALLSGQTVEFFDGSKSRYGADGSYGYTYTDDGPVWAGQYRMGGESEVCVDFDNGSVRCDRFIMDGDRAVLITDDGLRFPVRNITVDGQ